MEYKELIEAHRRDFDTAVNYAKQEANAIRTGRANPDMVSDLEVMYNGTKVRVKEIAAITTPDPRSILIQPWDKGALAGIEKAIKESQLGMAPVVDSTGIRLTVPALTQERREEYVKLLHQKMEGARIKIRHVRENVLKELKHEDLREDDLRRGKDELQKVVDEVNGQIQELMDKKEQELMSA